MYWYLYTLKSDISRLYTIQRNMDMNLWRFVNNHRFFACNYLNTQSSNLCFLQKLIIAMAKPGLLGSFLPRFHRDFDWLWRPDADLLGCQHVTCWHRQWDGEGVEMGSWWPLIAGFLGEDMIIEEGNGVCIFRIWIWLKISWPEYGFHIFLQHFINYTHCNSVLINLFVTMKGTLLPSIIDYYSV